MSEMSERYADVDVATFTPEQLAALGHDIGYITIPGFANIAPADLLGVPFYITGVRYQKPTADKSRDSGYRDFLTLECTAAAEDDILEQLNRERITRGYGAHMTVVKDRVDVPVKEGERFIVNDGSTGIRRSLTRIYHALGLITVKKGEWDKSDLTPFDLPSNKWVAWDGGQYWQAADGTLLPYFTHRPDGVPLILFQARGLHCSHFVNEFTGPEGATTYYL